MNGILCLPLKNCQFTDALPLQIPSNLTSYALPLQKSSLDSSFPADNGHLRIEFQVQQRTSVAYTTRREGGEGSSCTCPSESAVERSILTTSKNAIFLVFMLSCSRIYLFDCFLMLHPDILINTPRHLGYLIWLIFTGVSVSLSSLWPGKTWVDGCVCG